MQIRFQLVDTSCSWCRKVVHSSMRKDAPDRVRTKLLSNSCTPFFAKLPVSVSMDPGAFLRLIIMGAFFITLMYVPGANCCYSLLFLPVANCCKFLLVVARLSITVANSCQSRLRIAKKGSHHNKSNIPIFIAVTIISCAVAVVGQPF